MPGVLISGLDANGAIHPVEVDDNGNLRVDLVSGVSVSTVIDQTNSLAVYQTSGTTVSVNVVTFNSNTPAVGLNETTDGVLRVVQMTDSVASVNVVSGSILVNEYTEESTAGPGDGTLAMGVADANGSIYAFRIGSGLMDRALRTVQAADSVSSVSCVSVAAGLNETNAGVLRTVLMTDSISSVNVVSGFIDALQVSGVAYSVASQALGLNETTDGVLRVVQMTDSTNSVNVVSSIGLNVAQVSGSAWSTKVEPSDLALGLNETTNQVLRTVVMTDSAASAQVKGIARQTNPTAASDAAATNITCDDLGRTITRPIQVRDLIATAYASITTGTETTLATATAGGFLDLIYVMCTNNSDVAVTVDLRPVVAGSVVASVRVPANGTAGVSLNVPYPMSESGNAWTADIPDITGTTVTVSALFSKEV